MRYTDWEINDFSGGLVDKIDDPHIPENISQDCFNFFSERMGVLKKRKGQSRLHQNNLGGFIQGLHPYYDGHLVVSPQFLTVANGIAYKWDGTTMVQIKDELSATQVTLFEDCVNYTVAFNGVNIPWKWNGSVVSNLEGAPPDGRYPVLHKERLFAVPVTDPSCLKWSEPFQPEEWPAVNYWYIKDGDGDFITCLTKFVGELVIFKRRSIHSLKGSSLDNFRLDEMDDRVGCVGPQGALTVGTSVYFVSDDGLYVFNGMRATNISEGKIPVFWSKINKQSIHKATVFAWKDKIWFSLPYEDSTVNNIVLVFDPENGSFWPLSGINASCFQIFNDGSSVKFYAGDSTEGFVNQMDVGDDDFGDPISAHWVGKTFDMGKASYLKKAKRAFVEQSPYDDNVPDLQLSLDYGDYNSVNLERDDGLVKQYRVYGINRWRYITPKLLHNEAGSCEVRSILIPFKPKHKPKVQGSQVVEK